MSHEIWNERFTQQAGRGDAWHKLGTQFDATNNDLTLADVIQQAGADYSIEVKPLSVNVEVPDLDAPNPANVSGFSDLSVEQQIALMTAPKPTKTISLETNQNAIIRMPMQWKGAVDQATVLGTCSERYVPVQNAQIAQAFEQVAKLYRPETCGVLKSGEIFFLTLNAGQFDVRVNGHDDQHNAYLYLFDKKTPGSVMTIGAGAVRVVCHNTMNAAESAARILIPFQHSEGIHALIDAVAAALLGLQSAQKAMRDAYQMMADKTLSAEQCRQTFEIAWPNPKLSQTILSLDTLTNPVDSPNNSQIDQVANALAKVAASTVIQDRISQAQKEYATRLEYVEYMRETAEASLMHMADGENLGLNGHTALNAVSETLEHRTERTRGNVAGDVLIGERARVMDRVYTHLLDVSRN